MLAKAEAVGAPLIILDDAINAIAAFIQLDDRMRISGKDADRHSTLVSAGNKVVLALKEEGRRRKAIRAAPLPSTVPAPVPTAAAVAATRRSAANSAQPMPEANGSLWSRIKCATQEAS